MVGGLKKMSDVFYYIILHHYRNTLCPCKKMYIAKSTFCRHGRGPTLLKNKTVMVYTMNRPGTVGTLDFVQIWVPLVKCMGANAITQLPATTG